MSYREEPRRAFTAGIAIDSYLLVTLASGVLALCDPGDKPLGVTEYPAKQSGELINVRLLNTGGTIEVQATGAVAVGGLVVVAADGKVAADPGEGARAIVGMSLTAVSAGGVIEIVPYGYGHNLS